MAKLGITWLRNLSFTYLFFPFFIFLFGWLHIWVAAAVSALLLYILYDWFRQPVFNGTLILNRKQWLWLLALAAIWTLLAVPVTWFGKNPVPQAVLYDLVYQPWPVIYHGHNLVYSTGFFLLPAWIGKAGGFSLALVASWCYTYIGVVLVLLWWVHYTGRQWVIAISLLFVFASGLDVLGYAWGTAVNFSADHIENAISGQWIYASQVTLLSNLPQHALAGWLGAALLLQKGPWLQKLVLIPVIALWSAYAAIGLLLWWLCLARWPIPADQYLARYKKVLLIMASAFCGLMMISYQADFIQPLKWEWPLQSINDTGLYFLFITSEVLLWLPVLFYITPLSAYERRMQACLLVLLLLVPLVKTGLYSNSAMLLSIPLLWIFWLWFSRGLRTAWKQQLPVKILAGILFAVGAVTPVLQLAKGAGTLYTALFHRPQARYTYGVAQLPYSWQYMGQEHTFFNQYLRKTQAGAAEQE